MTHDQMIEYLIKYTSFALTALGFFAGMYKIIMKGLDRKFDGQYEKLKLEIKNTYNGTIKILESRLDYIQEDNTKLGCVVGVNTAEIKSVCESVARLEATCRAMQQTCEHNHTWDHITERRKK